MAYIDGVMYWLDYATNDDLEMLSEKILSIKEKRCIDPDMLLNEARRINNTCGLLESVKFIKSSTGFSLAQAKAYYDEKVRS